jgi:hypothetical protein
MPPRPRGAALAFAALAMRPCAFDPGTPFMHADTTAAEHLTPVCENCGAALQGEFCHACGQSAHNPLHSLRHAVEDVFESFWHLDGRVFRTLRDLFVPGRVAINYLAGQRVRYVPPLRLFVILSLLTFFVGRVVFDGPTEVNVQRDRGIAEATTVEAVRKREAELLAEIRKAQQGPDGKPVVGVQPALVAAEVAVRGQANDRIAELTRPQAPPTRGGAKPAPGAAAERDPNPERTYTGNQAVGQLFSKDGRPYDPVSNPIRVEGWPDWINRWLNKRAARMQRNIALLEQDGSMFLQWFFGALPTALFVMVPLFALLLKLVHLGSGRGYLEHLVVALYSHAFLLIGLLTMFVLAGLGAVFTGTFYAVTSGLLQTLVLLWMPIYLLLMQRRVYRSGWPVTLLRYLVLGGVYMVLVGLATLYAVLAGLSS